MTDSQYSAPAAPETAPAKPRRRIVNRILWIAGPAVVLAIAGYLYVTGGRYAGTDNAYVQADHVIVAPQVAGRVIEVNVDDNQAVKKGDVLFRIDPEPRELAVAELEAQLGAIGEFLDASRDTYRGAVADLKSSNANLANKQAQLKRMQELRERGIVAQKMLEDAANEVATARGERDSDAAAVAKNRTMLGGSVETPLDKLSGFKVAEAKLAQAKLDLEHTVVRAPIDGVVGKTALQPGDFLGTGEAAMPLIANHLWVDANFKETDLTHVAVGQPATIEVDTYPGRTWHAHVESISPASGAQFSVLPAQNATGNWVKIVQRIPVRLELDDPDQGGAILRAGMSAVVEIDTGKQNTLLGRWFGADEDNHDIALHR
jgi:membrane fusion protein (multidrug efflux system)